jgi:predicted GH43/DUF377 family glycosyl hydrolase
VNGASWRKLGLLLHAQEFASKVDWSSGFTQAPNVVTMGDFVRVYFCTRPGPDSEGQFVSLGAFADFETLNPPKILRSSETPIMNLGARGTFDEFGTYPISVIKHEEEFFAYYGGWTRCESVPFDVAIGLAKSGDGESFARSGTGPVLAAHLTEPYVITSPKIRRFQDTWVLSYTSGQKWFLHDGRPEIVYKIRIAFSDDGVKWNRLGRNIIPDRIGEGEAQASPDIIFSGEKYHMFFCYRAESDFRHNRDNSYRIGYASSVDLVHWERDDTRFPLEPSETGWDSVMVAYPTVFEWADSTFMLYLGNEVGKEGIGLAVLEGTLT